jgi:hypothetical protein
MVLVTNKLFVHYIEEVQSLMEICETKLQECDLFETNVCEFSYKGFLQQFNMRIISQTLLI